MEGAVTQKAPSLCFVAPHLYPVLDPATKVDFVGGAEVQQDYISRECARRGYGVSVVSLDFGQVDGASISNVTIYKTHKPGAGLPGVRFFHPRLTKLWAALKRADADVYYVRCAGMLAGVVAVFCKRYSRTFIYNGAHDTDFEPGKHLIRFKRDVLLYEFGLKHADLVIAQNRRQQELARHYYHLLSVLIPNCYALPNGYNPTPDEKRTTILWVSTMREWKRPELFLALAKALPRYKFIMVGGPSNYGTDSYYNMLCDRAAGIENLTMTGFVPYDQVDGHFDNACLFINTSISEGFPNTFLQAWARGVPTVSLFRLQGSASDIMPGSYVDTYEELLEQVTCLMGDEHKRIEMGRACEYYYRNNHQVEKIVDRFLRAIIDAADHSGGDTSQVSQL